MNKKFMGNFSLFMIMMSAFVGVFANDIYITQSGVTLDLAVTQDGDNNVMGTSGARVTVTGANATWTVSQVGDSNIISATILGATYTGTWAVTGSANDIAFLCSSGGTGKCESVDVDIVTFKVVTQIWILQLVRMQFQLIQISQQLLLVTTTRWISIWMATKELLLLQ